MIETMKMVHIVDSVSRKDEMLSALRDLGIVHLAEKKSADRAVSDRVAALIRTTNALKDFAPAKGEGVAAEVLSDEEFEKLYAEVNAATEKKSSLQQEISAANAEIERIREWGDFSPAEVKTLRDAGFDFHFYRLGAAELQDVMADESIRFIRLSTIDKQETIAVMGQLPATITATEFSLPEKSMNELTAYVSDCENGIAQCDEVFKKAALHAVSFNAQILAAQNDESFSAASATAQSDEDFVWLSGYIPETELDSFKAMAAEKKCAWAVEDVADDDENIPTKVRYSKVSKLIQPVFNILGILPGYREQDISLWFFLFFILFFAMIIGDAGYGALILLGTIAIAVKTKKMNDTVFLLLVLSIATVAWGSVTGTWFGTEAAMNIPFLRALVIPSFANYPELFGVTATAQQNAIMKFSFTIGAVQMALGSLLSIRKKIAEKNLSWVADLGWMIAIVAMYLLSLFLVIGDPIPVAPVFAAIGVAFVMVVIFGGMTPDKTFGQGLKSGLADAFTVFLNTISCFGNVMSYIRLFAVGMAGLAIAQSFNSIAAGFKGPLVVVGIIVILIGHGLNLIMCFLSVVVHGVRLNVLEFSGQVGLEWTGIEYDPFKKNNKIK